ncbi:hypothetical protein [Clostridium sp. ZS2-4]|uniref:hypothetical protein n=1 Tax=Clostridium sp. ZS2-4 TaxID=2987703 RepID=UPI002279FD48|nr:hypothetical protein [Clostridium sp. ZS2-4]MCY6354359.1 hypothetical protein [Clostridium sp. ZS2-4]
MVRRRFKSDSDEIKHYIVEQLKDNKAYSIAEIKEYVEAMAGRKFTNSKYAGVLARLVKSKDYMNIERGFYMKAMEIKKLDIKTVTAEIFKESINKIDKYMNKLNLRKLSKEELDSIETINETISILEQKLNIKE